LDSSNVLLQDRLYLNDGKGAFNKASHALPTRTTSGSVVMPEDVDGDGDIDLFVGGRQVPGLYPLPADSYLMINEGGVFKDETRQRAPDLINLGLVTDALWLDHNGDGDPDLFVAGEWMPVSLFINRGGTFVRDTSNNGLNGHTGWWYSLAAGDMDGDGDQDLIAGNLGLNTRYKATSESPFEIYAGDFDLNGTLDPLLVYNTPEGRYPVEGRNKLFSQLPFLARLYPSYNAYAEAEVEDLLSQDALRGALHLQANVFKTVWFERLDGDIFRKHDLPNEMQIAPVRAIIVDDFDRDGHNDILAAGNNYGIEVESVRMDAGRGVLLKGTPSGKFHVLPFSRSGFYTDADVRDIRVIVVGGKKCILVASNDGPLSLFTFSD
jgi:hypothetical protein